MLCHCTAPYSSVKNFTFNNWGKNLGKRRPPSPPFIWRGISPLGWKGRALAKQLAPEAAAASSVTARLCCPFPGLYQCFRPLIKMEVQKAKLAAPSAAFHCRLGILGTAAVQGQVKL